MKPFLKLTFAALAAIFAGPVAFALVLGLSVVPCLGTSYPVINATSSSDLTGQTAKVQEEKWVRRVVLGSDYVYQSMPFGDNMMGEGDSGKAIVKITDTEKLQGNIVNVPTVGGFGGPMVVGGGARDGTEEKFQVGNFQVKIGRVWTGTGFQTIARDETVIGTRMDQAINDGLQFKHSRKRNDDIMMLMREYGRANFRNILRPSGLTEATLKTANVLSTSLLSLARNNLSGLGAEPMALGKQDSGGSRIEKFMALSTQYGLNAIDNEDNYIQGLRYAQERGAANSTFTGEYTEFNGMGLYRWYNKDTGAWGPSGSPLAARAFLSAATTISITAPTTITGGGTAAAAAALPAPEFYTYFRNAPFTYSSTDTIAGVTGVTTLAYFLIIDSADPTKFACVAYSAVAANGSTLTTAAADADAGGVASGHSPLVAISGGVTTARSWAAGSLIVQCNVLGVPFGFTPVFGRGAVAVGQGSINGSAASPQMGRRTYQERNSGLDISIGAEAAWGAAIIKRADGVAPGFLMIQHAITVPGAPNIT